MRPVLILATVVLALIFGVISSAGPARAGVVPPFTVNSTANGQDADTFDPDCETAPGNGICTLRAAIEQANATAASDTIAFDIPTIDPGYSVYGTYKIEPLSPLPVIGNPVIIDGWTQPGFVDRPVILLCGISAGALVDGLRINSGNTTVRGLVISAFGIVAGSDGIEIQGAGNNVIEGNFIGVNAAHDVCRPGAPKVTGTETDPNMNPNTGDEWGNAGSGIFINGSSNNTIGGTAGTTPGGPCTGACNIISGAGRGVPALSDAHGVEICANFPARDCFGTAATGNVVIGNRIGIDVGGGPETGAFCADNVDSDGDAAVNDGCPANTVGVSETDCGPAESAPLDDDSDGVVNDGCPAVGGAETGQQCANAIDDDDDDGVGGPNSPGDSTNDGCPAALDSVPETGTQCANNTDNEDNYAETPVKVETDALVNDGCPVVIGGTKDLGNKGDGVNIYGVSNNTIGGSQIGAGNVISANDSNGVEIAGGPEAGTACTGAADSDGDLAVNDGCPQVGATAESGAQCANAVSDDDDNLDSVINLLDAVNDGCPAVKVASGNHVEGNFIGTTASGGSLPAGSKQFYGVLIDGAPGNTIGGTAGTTPGGPCTGACNIVSGNLSGIQIQGGGATGNLVQGSYVGTDITGAVDLGNLSSGVIMATGASSNTIGGTVAGAGNVVSGNNLHGIEINSGTTTGNQVQGNFIGTNAAGTAELFNGQPAAGTTGRGIRINLAPGNTIGGAAAGRNVISGNTKYGIEIVGATASGNVVQSNYIGTDVTGTAVVGNWQGGVVVDGAPGTLIGGTTSAARNVISGNGQGSQAFIAQGILILGSGATGTLVHGNLIGTDVNGTAPVSNLGIGVLIVGAPTNTVGGTSPGARNVISGNGIHGVEIDAAGGTGNLVSGNYIGLDMSGNAALGNGGDGVLVSDAPGNTVGGIQGGAKNVISGNGSMGVEILGIASSSNLVQGNFIGTDLTGGGDIGNAQHGVFVNGAPDNTIGGTTTGARNVVSGNGTGVFIQNGGATGNDIVGNFIGTNAIGTGDVGNTFDGVRLGGDASNNVVGGPSFADANIIAYNGGDGVDLDATAGTGNRIQRSTIFSNDGLGIDLFPDGVTPNDLGDGDPGPNNLQNYPDLTSANSTLSGTTIVGTLNSTANTTFSIYFFSDISCDPSGFGEGRTFIGSTSVGTDVGGNIGFNVTVPGIAANGHVVNATATDPAGNTSEFSECQTATGVAQPVLKQGDVNCDNSVNAVDALLVLRFGAGLGVNQNEPCPDIGTVLTLAGVFGDVDCTGMANAVDALKILRFGAGLSVVQNEPPPCTDLGQPLP